MWDKLIIYASTLLADGWSGAAHPVVVGLPQGSPIRIFRLNGLSRYGIAMMFHGVRKVVAAQVVAPG